MKPTQPPCEQPTDALAAAPDSAPADNQPAVPEALAGALPAWDLLPQAPFLRSR